MSDNFRNNHKWTRDDFASNHNYAYGVVLHVIIHFHRTSTPFTIRNPSDLYKLCLPTISNEELKILEMQVLGLIGEIRCLETGVVLVFSAGNQMEMLSLDQGNPALNGDAVGQSWSSVCWGYNRLINKLSIPEVGKLMCMIDSSDFEHGWKVWSDYLELAEASVEHKLSQAMDDSARANGNLSQSQTVTNCTYRNLSPESANIQLELPKGQIFESKQ
ncbi:hypothetical protein HK100_012600 [Physocladia obscura]|uniref:Uncharacterized protein n=1 Tax=Physocladia obscura TaxID=109957 RepID=A0AAD5SZM3_9FUNG|nr:hypothetical protein HK100_012600 [Physocladia obscura]